MKLKDLFRTVENDDQWISVSDMMTGLMVIFLLLFLISTNAFFNSQDESSAKDGNVLTLKKSLSVLQQEKGLLENEINLFKTNSEKQNIEIQQLRSEMKLIHSNILNKKSELITELQSLWTEKEKKDYGIKIEPTGEIFLEKGRFNQGDWTVLPPMKQTLNSIMPRLIEYIEDKGSLIERIEIVGHASPEWPECDPSEPSYNATKVRTEYNGDSINCAYYENMILSQKRSFSVLKEIDYIVNNQNIILPFKNFTNDKNIIIDKFFANARSSSDEITTESKDIDYEKSRRAGLYMRYNLAEISKNISSKNLQYKDGSNLENIFNIQETIIGR